MEELSDLSRRIILALGNYTDAEIARMCGVSRSTPGKWKKGVPPGSDTLARMCLWLGVSPGWVLLGKGEMREDVPSPTKVIGRIDSRPDKVSEAIALIEEWTRQVDKPDQRVCALLDKIEREYPEFAEWQKKREQLGKCGTPGDTKSANGS